EAYQPLMQAAADRFAMDTITMWDDIATPRLPESCLASLESQTEEVCLTQTGTGLAITVANPQGMRMDMDVVKLGGGAFFPTMVYYDITMKYRVLEGFERLKGIRIELKNGEGKIMADKTLWEGSLQQEGELSFRLVHGDKEAENQVGLYMFMAVDKGAVTLEITKLDIRATKAGE
nr:hypothetical protein [bacterium]